MQAKKRGKSNSKSMINNNLIESKSESRSSIKSKKQRTKFNDDNSLNTASNKEDEQNMSQESIPESSNEIKKILQIKEIYDYNIAKAFFKKHKEYADTIVDIKNQKHKVSLRILDWFAITYTKKNNILYEITLDNIKQNFDVHLSYESQLSTYKKERFDPFARRISNRDSFFIFKFPKSNKKIVTNIKQLNFLVWAFKYKIIEYVEDHLVELTKAMNAYNKESRKNRESKKKERENKKLMIKNGKDINLSFTRKFKAEKESLEISWD